MNRILFFIALILPFSLLAQISDDQDDDVSSGRTILLPNGWKISPTGRSIQLGDLPLNLAVSSSGKYMAVTNNGVGAQMLQLIDTKNEKILCNTTIAKSWLGLKFSSDERYLYASGGNDNKILKYAINADTLTLEDSIVLGKKWPEKISPAGLEIDDAKHKLYAVTKGNNTLYVANLGDNTIEKKIKLSAEAFTCLLSGNKKQLFISLWGGAKILVFNTKTGVIEDSISVGRNPNDMCITENGKYLFVANSLDNSVSVIDVKKKKVIETLNAALYPDAPNGSTTNSVALSPDNHTLYIANADNNCLAVFDIKDIGHSSSKGFIPTGWYPTCVRTIDKKIFVSNGKGFSSAANPKGPQPVRKHEDTKYKQANKKNEQYIGSLLKGALSVIEMPDEKQLSDYSAQVYKNTPYSKDKEMEAAGEAGNPIPQKVGAPSPIKHVFYVIKENRTYDQVLGDMPKGNGDTSLVLFGKKITPNQHALAEQFVLLDNFYVDAEVSADGHNWSTAAYANDYVEKTWPTEYGGRGGMNDYYGTHPIAFPKDGFVWDYAIRKGVSFRDYGEFCDDDGTMHVASLKKYACLGYPGWKLSIKDQQREAIWEHDFDSLLARNEVPQLNILYLPDDHTSGLSKGAPTPFAHVADNELALGKLIEHLSQSGIWNESVVFVLEDDAQNGPDHVDAHRSIAFVAGAYVKRNFVDPSMYSTSGMLRTIELILGLPPMSQYDAAARPMWKCFQHTADVTPFKHMETTVNLDEKNVAVNELSRQSDHFDLANADRVPDKELNEVLWKSIKGLDKPIPAPKRSAFLALHQGKDKDDD